MSENLTYVEQKFWNRQVEARLRNQNFMKLSPDDVEFLLNSIRAERDSNAEKQTRLNEVGERLNAAVGPEYWGVRLLDAVENELKKPKEFMDWLAEDLRTMEEVYRKVKELGWKETK